MLVLTRREGEKIIIGDSIAITIVRMVGDKVRIGIQAPEDVLILRSELEVYEGGQCMTKGEAAIPSEIPKPAA